MKKRLKATTIDENFRTFLASKRSSGVREKTILSYHQAYQAINKHYPIGEMDMTAFHADTLNALIEALLRAKRAAYRFGYRKSEKANAAYPTTALVSSDNVANRLAEDFYRSHGVVSIEPAIEVKQPAPGEEQPVMHTRYCLRRQLGACLLTPSGSSLPRELYLRSGNIELRVECTCNDCGMKLYATRKK